VSPVKHCYHLGSPCNMVGLGEAFSDGIGIELGGDGCGRGHG
jgi:hypothetical protein